MMNFDKIRYSLSIKYQKWKEYKKNKNILFFCYKINKIQILPWNILKKIKNLNSSEIYIKMYLFHSFAQIKVAVIFLHII